MGQVHAFLGRANPAATTDTTIYTSAASTKTLISCIHVCNTSGAGETFRIHFVPSGGTADTSNAVIYNLTCPSGIPFILNGAYLLETGDFISVRSSGGNCTFSASGVKIT